MFAAAKLFNLVKAEYIVSGLAQRQVKASRILASLGWPWMALCQRPYLLTGDKPINSRRHEFLFGAPPPGNPTRGEMAGCKQPALRHRWVIKRCRWYYANRLDGDTPCLNVVIACAGVRAGTLGCFGS